MNEVRFTEKELETFVSYFERTPDWASWERRDDRGRDVIAVRTAGRKPGMLRLAKTATGCYAARGFDVWGLTVCLSLAELLDTLAAESETHQAA